MVITALSAVRSIHLLLPASEKGSGFVSALRQVGLREAAVSKIRQTCGASVGSLKIARAHTYI